MSGVSDPDDRQGGRRRWVVPPILRGVTRNTRWSATHDVGLVVLSFASFIALQRVLSLEEYGSYLGLHGLLGVLGAFSVSGVTFAALQRVVVAPDQIGATINEFASFAAVAGLGAVVVGVAVASMTLDLSVATVLVFAFVELVVRGVIGIAAVGAHATRGYPSAVRVRLVDIVLRLGVLVTLTAGGQLTIWQLGVGYLAVEVAYVAFLYGHMLPSRGHRIERRWPTRRPIRESGAFAVPIGASQFQTDGDKYLLNAFGYAADAGKYGAAYRIVQFANLPMQAIEVATFHRFLERGDGSPREHVGRARVVFVLLAGLGTLAAIGLALALPLVDLLLDESFDEALDVVPWLLVLIPLVAVRNIPLNGLLGLNRLNERMLVYIAGAVVTMCGYLVLIPLWSWRGAIVATVAGELVLVGAGWLMLVRLQVNDGTTTGPESLTES